MMLYDEVSPRCVACHVHQRPKERLALYLGLFVAVGNLQRGRQAAEAEKTRHSCTDELPAYRVTFFFSASFVCMSEYALDSVAAEDGGVVTVNVGRLPNRDARVNIAGPDWPAE